MLRFARNDNYRLGRTVALVLVLICAAVPAAAGGPVVLAFGDSLTAGFGLSSEQAFPAQLEARLHKDGVAARVINGGISGDTTAAGLARLDWALADQPDLVILELGANDLLRGIPPEIARANLDAMIAKIQASGAKVLLAGMKAPTNWGEDYEHAFDRIYPELAHDHNVTLYPFFLDGVATDPKLNQADGLHPNERGVAVVVDHVAPIIEQMLGGKS